MYEMPLTLPKMIQSLSWSNHYEVAEVRCPVWEGDVPNCRHKACVLSKVHLVVCWCRWVGRWCTCEEMCALCAGVDVLPAGELAGPPS